MHGTNLVLNHVVAVIASGVMIIAVTEIYLGSEQVFFKCLKYGLKMSCALCVMVLLQNAVIGVGLLLLILPSIYFAIRFCLAEPIVVIENVIEVSGMHEKVVQSHKEQVVLFRPPLWLRS